MSHPARRPRPHGAPQSFPLPHTCPRALAHACACGARSRCARVCSTALLRRQPWRAQAAEGVWGPLKKTPERGCSTPGWAVRVHTQAVCSARHTRGTQPDTRGCCVHSSPPAPAPSQPMVGQRLPPCPRQPRGLPGSPSLAGSRGQWSPACMGGDITGVAGPGARRQPIPPDPHPPGPRSQRGRSSSRSCAGNRSCSHKASQPGCLPLAATKTPNLPSPLLLENPPKSISQPRCCGRGHGLSPPSSWRPQGDTGIVEGSR